MADPTPNPITLAALAPWGAALADPERIMTAEELLLMGDASVGYELIAGRLVKMSPTGGRHGNIESRLDRVLGNYIDSHDLGVLLAGEPGFILSRNPDTVLAPDLAFIRSGREPDPNSPLWDEYLPVIPDLVIEVVSPSQYKPEMLDKANKWLAAGVRLVWVVWPKAQQVDVWRPGQPLLTLNTGDQLDGYDILPGFAHPVGKLFA
jgi:Uma2 family endonuclease